jgi:hypothetical protein
VADIIGTGGRLKSERLAEMNQNGWPIEIGMGGRNGSEYAKVSPLLKVKIRKP